MGGQKKNIHKNTHWESNLQEPIYTHTHAHIKKAQAAKCLRIPQREDQVDLTDAGTSLSTMVQIDTHMQYGPIRSLYKMFSTNTVTAYSSSPAGEGGRGARLSWARNEMLRNVGEKGGAA